MWELIRKIGIGNFYKRKKRIGYVFKWKYDSNSQGFGVN
jgi:hypothetical protein